MRTSSDRKSTRLNSSHPSISYAVFCLKKKRNDRIAERVTKKHDTSGKTLRVGRAHVVLPQYLEHRRAKVAGPAGGAFFFNDTAPTEIYTLSLHDALPI